MRFLVVDDHPILRLGVRQLIEHEWPHAQVVEAASIKAATAAATAQFDAIVLDLVMPDVAGSEGLATMLAAAPGTPILVLSQSAEDHAPRLLQMGAAGYLQKDRAADELVLALQRVLAGARYITASMADRLVNLLSDARQGVLPHERLSVQEHRVMLLLADGQTPAQISAQLGVSARTVATYRTRIFQKTGWKTNVELAKYCVQHGLTRRPG